MTESEWLEQPFSWEMYKYALVGAWATPRKLRLMAVGCCRRIHHLLPQDDSCDILDVVERFADGLVNRKEPAATLGAAHFTEEAIRLIEGPLRHANYQAYLALRLTATRDGDFAYVASSKATKAIRAAAGMDAFRQERAGQGDLARDLFGNPFRPPHIDPEWLAWHSGTVKQLAEAAYHERLLPAGTLDQTRLAILADALEEAGAAARLLEHLRGPGPHWRGCWCVDLLTGRS
jgi:hypothetical protein